MNQKGMKKKSLFDWSVWGLGLFLLAFPISAVNFLNPKWIGHLTASVCFDISSILFFVWLLLHPEELTKDRRATKQQEEANQSSRKVWNKIAKGFCALVIGYFLYNDIPLAKDISQLNDPSVFQTRKVIVSSNEAGPPLIWWLDQTVLFTGDTLNSYRLNYSWEYIHPGKEYEFTYLKNSKTIVDVK
jgi:hypothetical protein